MARHISLAAFLATLAIVVPAAWHAPGADIQHDGKKLRPLAQELVLDDGTRVSLSVDRAIAITGSTVTATLVAYSETPKQVVVDLALLQSNNYEGARVETPAIAIDHEKLTLSATADGGKPVTTRLKLGVNPHVAAMTDDFKLLITPHGTEVPEHETGMGRGVDYSSLIEAHHAAGVNIRGWSGNSLAMSIEPEGPITAGAPFVVAVRVKNTSHHALAERPNFELGTQLSLEGSVEPGDDFEITELDAVEDRPAEAANDDVAPSVKRGEQIVRRYRVTPKAKGLSEITFVAIAESFESQPGPVAAGAMDVRTFPVGEAAPKGEHVAVQ